MEFKVSTNKRKCEDFHLNKMDQKYLNQFINIKFKIFGESEK
ncbi:hypothetical protein T479_16845 [Lysinibacillus varians]|nr:hypothetical protein T479_16845 [Lysinibacillus varians]